MGEREIMLVAEVDAWFVDLAIDDPASADLVERAIDLLAAEGPKLGRPMVDRVRASRHQHPGHRSARAWDPAT